jgi:tetratricopeptide (TPR) repeat protein
MSAPPSTVWTVPPPHPDFVGRESELAALEAALSAGGVSALTQPTTMHGLGGIGKTQLALAFAARHFDLYTAGFWLPAENPTALAVAFADLARELRLPEADDPDQRRRTEAVRRWLASPQSGLWLLVFDNAERREDVAPYLPAGRRGHVLITSRNPEWRPLAKAVKIRRLPRKESMKLLCQGLDGADEQAAAALAEELGDLPLALAQAAAFVRATACGIDDYLREFRGRWAEFDAEQEAEPGYGRTVAVTLGMALDRLHEQGDETAEEVLRRCAFLAPDSIPRDLLADEARDERAVGRAIAALHHYSLVETAAPGFVSLHRLVQKAVRERIPAEERAARARRAVGCCHSTFPNPDDYGKWGRCGVLLTHALQAVEHAEPLAEAAETRASLLARLGIYLWRRCELAEARRCLERALRLKEEAYGPEHPEVAAGLGNLGLVLQDLGELAEARRCQQRALCLTEGACGPDHPLVAVTLGNLGRVLADLGELAEARRCQERALRLKERAHGPEHPSVAITLGNLGRVLTDLGELAEARRCQERALRLKERAHGPEHPSVAITLGNLGLVLTDLGELAEARRCQERALSLTEGACGPDHPSVAIALGNLGLVLAEQGELAEARRCQERALRLSEQAYGPEHPSVAFPLVNLGLVLAEQGELAEARRCQERALRIYAKAYEANHPYAAIARGYLGDLSRLEGRLREARHHLERALPLLERSYGTDHASVACVLSSLGLVAKDEGNPAEARAHLVRALAIFRVRFGDEHHETAKTRKLLQGVAEPANASPPAAIQAPVIKLLFLSAEPFGRGHINIKGEIQAVRKKIAASRQGERFEFIEEADVQLDALPGLLTQHQPHIVHFTGHGTEEGNLLLLGDDGEEVEASPELLTAYLRNLRLDGRLCVALFNCCHSDRVARAAVRTLDCAIGMTEEIPDQAAPAFAGDFYLMLASGTSVKDAYETARLRMSAEPMMKRFTALKGSAVVKDLVKLHTRDGVDPARVVLVPALGGE